MVASSTRSTGRPSQRCSGAGFEVDERLATIGIATCNTIVIFHISSTSYGMSTAKLIASKQQICGPVARGNEDGNMNGTIESDHTVVVDESVTPNTLRFSAVFNVAVSFIDRQDRKSTRLNSSHLGISY